MMRGSEGAVRVDRNMVKRAMRRWGRIAGRAILALAIGISAAAAVPSAQAAGGDSLTIPSCHPRILFATTTSCTSSARLTQAQTWYASNPFTPSSATDNALKYVLTGDTAAADAAINSLMAFTIPAAELSGTASDTYRWNDWVPIVFDWVYNRMSEADRATFIARYDSYVNTMRLKSWGGPGKTSNNYYWGYWRNELNWAIATYGHSSNAQTFLDWALVTRWQNDFLPWAASSGAGGLPNEGSQYGPYMLGYAVVPLLTMKTLGRDLLAETLFYQEAADTMIYATQGGRSDLFPFNDDEVWRNGNSATKADLGNFMTVAALAWPTELVGKRARQWLNSASPSRSKYIKAIDPGGTALSFVDLPLDYHALGSLHGLYFRTSWADDATALFFELGLPSRVGHKHLDAGSFQIRRGADWLSRESVGYTETILGDATAQVKIASANAHNVVTFNGIGQANAYLKGSPQVTAVDLQPFYSYAAVNLSDAYRAVGSPDMTRDDNPYASHVEREFVFVRALNTLVILDRMVASDSSVKMAFLAHGKSWTVSGTVARATVGASELVVRTLRPITATRRVVTEGGIGQARLQVEQTGLSTHFIHTLQAKAIGASDVTASVTEYGGQYVITLTHPTLGQAVVKLSNGSVAAGVIVTPVLADTTPPVISSVASSAVTETGATITSWTTDESSTSQVEYGLTAAYGSTTTADTALVTGHSVALTGLTPNTLYHFRVKSMDASANLASGSDQTVTTPTVSPTPTGTTLPPSVSLTAPANADTVSGTVTVIAMASDDEGVAHVQFLLDGAPLGAEDSTNTYSVSWDTTTVSAGTYTLTAVVTDVGGAQSVSSPVAVTVDNAPPVISNTNVSNVTADAATVTWATDESADSVVEYGATTAYGDVAGDGAFVTSHASTLTKLATGTPQHFRIRSTDRAGSASVSGDGTFTTADGTSTTAPASPAFLETNGRVVIEAEHYDATVSRSSHDWVRGTAKLGFAGEGYLEALPNTGATVNTGYVTTSPELIYRVQFATPGTYYVWIRGYAASGSDDSVHAGLDGVGLASADRLNGFGNGWNWSRTTMDGAKATLQITTPGLHTIHIWMREDGFKVDKILLRTSSSSTAPSGSGPVESPRMP